MSGTDTKNCQRSVHGCENPNLIILKGWFIKMKGPCNIYGPAHTNIKPEKDKFAGP
jgi:hypothetical protein